MNSIESGPKPPQSETLKLQKLSRQEVEYRIKQGENLENFDLQNLDLAGLNFEGISFRGSDVRGVIFFRQTKGANNEVEKITTNLKNTDWTDALFARFDLNEQENEGNFIKVDAQGATFGFTESLAARRERHNIERQEKKKTPTEKDSGAYLNFIGSSGNFENTKWMNIDFGGDKEGGYEAIFFDADLSNALFTNCDLSYIEFSETKIDGLKIKDPHGLEGLIIKENQISSLIQAIEYTDSQKQAKFLAEVKNNGPKKILEEFLHIKII